jgi:hypothetical protein
VAPRGSDGSGCGARQIGLGKTRRPSSGPSGHLLPVGEGQKSFRARRTCLDPLPSGLDKLGVGEGRQCPCRSIGPASRFPCPKNERLLFMMFHDVRSVELAKNRATDLCARQRLIIPVLPFHGERREMPIVSAGHAGAVGVHRLMARPAVESGHTFVLRAANHVRKVTMPVVSLLRIVRCCVAIDATWRSQYRIDLLPRGKTIGGFCEKYCDQEREHVTSPPPRSLSRLLSDARGTVRGSPL